MTLRGTQKTIGDKFDTIEHGLRVHAEKTSERTCSKILTCLSGQDQHLEDVKDALLGQMKPKKVQRQARDHNTIQPAEDFPGSSYGRLRDLDCPSSCVCICHLKPCRGRWTFQVMASVLGHMSISHQGLEIRSQPCTDKRCYGRQRWLRVDYCLPQWLLSVAVSVFFSSGPPAPEMVLRVIRQVDLDASELYVLHADILRYVKARRIKNLFHNRTT